MRRISCTISGSFRRFLPQIAAAMRECNALGVTVLSPRSGSPSRQVNGFVFVEGDRGAVEDVERRHLRDIRNSDFLYVVNPGGYTGPSATLEIGHALGASVPVFCMERPEDPVIARFVHVSISISEIVSGLAAPSVPQIPPGAGLGQLQSYIAKVVALRGFQEETLRDVTLLLMEEVGELAKAVRQESGLKVSARQPGAPRIVAEELVDCLVYILDLANLTDVDLEHALRQKEALNAKRVWRVEADRGHPRRTEPSHAQGEERERTRVVRKSRE